MALSQAEFDDLVALHADVLYRVAYRLVGDRHDAEDVVQDAFRSAWTSRGRYQHGRGDRAWLISILRRRVADRHRRRRLRSVLSGESVYDIGVEPVDPFDDQYTDEMQQALMQLPAELREALLLVVVGELTHREAADELQVPLGTVLSRVSRARARMREALLSAHRPS